MSYQVSAEQESQEYRIFFFACTDPSTIIQHVQLRFAGQLKGRLHTVIGSEQCVIVKTNQLRMLNRVPILSDQTCWLK